MAGTAPISTILRRLYAHYDRQEYDGPDDLLGVLVRTILSQQTTRTHCERAFQNLIDRYSGRWGRVRAAPRDELEEVVAVAGLAGQKAARIQGALATIFDDHGRYSLEFLRTQTLDQARQYLTSFHGVGPKTAAFTLMFAANMAAFPMDTHILRISRRLGWIDQNTSNVGAHQLMEAQIPPGEHYPAHMALVRHGRQMCHARRPDCAACPVAEMCPSAAQ